MYVFGHSLLFWRPKCSKNTFSFVSVWEFNGPGATQLRPDFSDSHYVVAGCKTVCCTRWRFPAGLLVSTWVGEIKFELVSRLQNCRAALPRTVKVNQPHPVFFFFPPRKTSLYKNSFSSQLNSIFHEMIKQILHCKAILTFLTLLTIMDFEKEKKKTAHDFKVWKESREGKNVQ